LPGLFPVGAAVVNHNDFPRPQRLFIDGFERPPQGSSGVVSWY
jgi:hypothetical protein